MFRTILSEDPDNENKEITESEIILDTKEIQKLHKILDKYLIDKLLGI